MEELTASRGAGRAMGIDLDRAVRAIDEFLRTLGHDPDRDRALSRTSTLVAEAYAHDLLAGYTTDPAGILADSIPAKGGDLVIVRDLATTAVCPHHLLPASGVVHVAYVPSDRVAGLGALARLVDCYARRLTLQEPMAQTIADALVTELGARASGCAADLRPACLGVRGERRHEARVASVATAGETGTVERVRTALVGLVSEAT